MTSWGLPAAAAVPSALLTHDLMGVSLAKVVPTDRVKLIDLDMDWPSISQVSRDLRVGLKL